MTFRTVDVSLFGSAIVLFSIGWVSLAVLSNRVGRLFGFASLIVGLILFGITASMMIARVIFHW